MRHVLQLWKQAAAQDDKHRDQDFCKREKSYLKAAEVGTEREKHNQVQFLEDGV